MLSYASYYKFFRINWEKCYKNRAENWTPWEKFSAVKSKGIRKGFSNIVTPKIVKPNIVTPNIVTPYKIFQGSKIRGFIKGFETKVSKPINVYKPLYILRENEWILGHINTSSTGG